MQVLSPCTTGLLILMFDIVINTMPYCNVTTNNTGVASSA